jgi:hypothetical protein
MVQSPSQNTKHERTVKPAFINGTPKHLNMFSVSVVFLFNTGSVVTSGRKCVPHYRPLSIGHTEQYAQSR